MTPADEALCSDIRKRLAIRRTVKWGDPGTILVDKEVFDAIPKLLDRIAELGAEVEQAKLMEADARRYRWLRDKSVPPHNFYLSVPVEFKDERYSRADVDAAIDAALAAKKQS